MTWAPHIKSARKKGSQALGMSYMLISNNSKLSLRNKLLLFTQIVRPTFIYGSLVWGTAAPSYIHSLQVIQNKFLRIATNAPPYTNTINLHKELGIPMLTTYLKELNTKKIKKAELHENPLITQALDYTPISRVRRNRPKTALITPDVT